MGLQEHITPDPLVLPRPVRVLIVEDHPLVAAAAQDMLESIGGSVTAIVGTMQEAEQACGTLAFDIVLLDADLAGLSSLPIATMLVTTARPFVVVTGSDRAPHGFGSGPVLTKPYTLRALHDALVTALT